MRMHDLPWLGLVAFGLACASVTAPEVVGSWGGADASLTLTPSGGEVQFACGSGTIEPGWTMSAGGAFAAKGQYYAGGGPVPAEGRPPHPASYLGQVRGSTFTFIVAVPDLDAELGPFVMVWGGPAVSEICL